MGVWKTIRKGWEDVEKHLIFEVGGGNRINFWHDSWCGEGSLKSQFLEIYALARDKKALVCYFLVRRRNWELENFAALFDVIYGVMFSEEEDICR